MPILIKFLNFIYNLITTIIIVIIITHIFILLILSNKNIFLNSFFGSFKSIIIVNTKFIKSKIIII